MAEVPEVETMAGDMRALVVGRRILSAHVLLPAAVRLPAPEAFAAAVAGRAVEGCERRAKWLLCPLSGGDMLALHMMLHGTLLLKPAGAPPDPETLLIFALSGDEDLWLRDRKGYARAAAGPADLVAAGLKLSELGPELLDPAFTAADLLGALRGRRGVLKSALVNQSIVAGLGNRDVDESLWEAQIDPRRVAGSLSEAEAERLLACARMVLAEGLELRGTMPDLRGVRGRARQDRKIYGHAGEPCPRCGTPIARSFIGQAITFACPGCQR